MKYVQNSNFLFVLLLTMHSCVEGAYYDYTHDDYCRMSCPSYNETTTDRIEHVACKCKMKRYCTNVTMPLENLVAFRQAMLDRHNELRSQISAGKESRGTVAADFGLPANMNLLHYQISLEYVALCHAVSCPRNESDRHPCRHARGYIKGVGQNIYSRWLDTRPFLQAKNTSVTYDHFKGVADHWYDQVLTCPPDVVEHFNDHTEHGDGHEPAYESFSCLYWAKLTDIGCAVTALLGSNNRYIAEIVVCNYGTKEGNCNSKGMSIYHKGTPASNCSGDDSKSAEYPFLCGKPTLVTNQLIDGHFEDWKEGNGKGHATKIRSSYLLCSLVLGIILRLGIFKKMF